MQKLLNVKNTVIESYNFHNDVDGITHLRIKARPNAWHQDDCPFCGRRHLPRYDRPAKKNKICVDWTFQELSLRLKRLPTELSARSMAYLVCSNIRILLPNRKSNVQNMA